MSQKFRASGEFLNNLLAIGVALVTGMLILTSLAFGPFQSGQVSKIELRSDIYSRDNALSAATQYMEQALTYSAYQACYDSLLATHPLTTTESEFLDTLAQKTKENINRYTAADYTFLNMRAQLPAYGHLMLFPTPLTTRAAAPEYEVEFSFTSPQHIIITENDYSGSDIQRIVESIDEDGTAQDSDEHALYLAFSENRHLLEEGVIQSMRVLVTSGTPLSEQQQIVAEAVLLDALSKFKPEFIEQHISTITVTNGFRVAVNGGYFENGLKPGQTVYQSGDFSLPEHREIIINYHELTAHGPRVIYKQLAQLMAFTSLDGEGWIAESGIGDLKPGAPRFITPERWRTGDPAQFYYIGSAVFRAAFPAQRPVTATDHASLNSPYQDFASLVAALLEGGEALTELERAAAVDSFHGYPQLSTKISAARAVVHKEQIVNSFEEQAQVLLTHYSAHPFDLSRLYSSDVMDALDRIDAERSTSTDAHARLSFFAVSHTPLKNRGEGNTTTISLNRSSGIYTEIPMGCSPLFTTTAAHYLQARDALVSAVTGHFSHPDLPLGPIEGVVAGDLSEGNRLCNKLFLAETGKTGEVVSNECEGVLANSVALSSMTNGLSFEGELLVYEGAVIPHAHTAVQKEPGMFTVTCSYAYSVNASFVVNGTDTSGEYPVFDRENVSMKALRTAFGLSLTYLRTPEGETLTISPHPLTADAFEASDMTGQYSLTIQLLRPHEFEVQMTAELSRDSETTYQGSASSGGQGFPITARHHGNQLVIEDVQLAGLGNRAVRLVGVISGTSIQGAVHDPADPTVVGIFEAARA